ncbi:hypothetical protein CSB69_3169 [Morganella morganii]|nr:hypothetical protein CSB69_3169 [Morganella morganii]
MVVLFNYLLRNLIKITKVIITYLYILQEKYLIQLITTRQDLR